MEGRSREEVGRKKKFRDEKVSHWIEPGLSVSMAQLLPSGIHSCNRTN
jgi:hypothetical protein